VTPHLGDQRQPGVGQASLDLAQLDACIIHEVNLKATIESSPGVFTPSVKPWRG
jgi:hypothetical protein